MDEQLIRDIVAGLLEKMQMPQEDGIPVEISARHVHLCQEDVERLFGAGHQLTPSRPLSQPGQFLCDERVRLVGPGALVERVAVLGPARGQTQVELSATDARTLGIDPPLRLSGDLNGACDLLIMAGERCIDARGSAIIAQNHIHVPPAEAVRRNLRDGQLVRVQVKGQRPVVFDRVIVRVHPEFALRMHIDFDEANACLMKGETLGYILPDECVCPSTLEG